MLLLPPSLQPRSLLPPDGCHPSRSAVSPSHTKALLSRSPPQRGKKKETFQPLSHAFNISSFFFCRKEVNSLCQLGCNRTTASLRLREPWLPAPPGRWRNVRLTSPSRNPSCSCPPLWRPGDGVATAGTRHRGAGQAAGSSNIEERSEYCRGALDRAPRGHPGTSMDPLVWQNSFGKGDRSAAL